MGRPEKNGTKHILPLEIITLGPITLVFFAGLLLIDARYGLSYVLNILYHPHLIFLSWLSLASLFISILYLLSPFGRLRGLLILLMLLIYLVLAGYHFNSHTSLDYLVIALNADSALYSEALEVVGDRIGYVPFIMFAYFFLIILIWGPVRKPFFSAIPYTRRRICIGFSAIVVFCILSYTGLSSYDEIGPFVRSAIVYYNDLGLNQFEDEFPEGTYPLVLTNKNASPPERTPNIFIIEIESFNPRFIDQRTLAGKEIMPVFTDLIDKGLYIEHFYGNSIQSSKGQFVTLFSLLPDLRYKEFIKHMDTHFYSLPTLLRENGYETWFVKAYKSIDFDNTGKFALQHGFDRAFSIHEVLSDEEISKIWGWGIEDKVFYGKFLKHLDTCDDVASGKKPIFAVLHTVMNHMMFDRTPEEYRYMFSAPKSVAENYANTMHLVDKHLSVFFEELRKREYLNDSLVIITGDHGFPTGEHGFVYNELSYYEEFFRTPFLLIYPQGVEPERITDVAYSQLDIAPTILDILGLIPPRHHFQGRSMMQPNNVKRPVILLQPYNGTYICVVEYPYKYVLHLRSGKELIYNLKKDPDEENPLAGSNNTNLLEKFRDEVKDIYINQYLLENDRIWPDTSQ